MNAADPTPAASLIHRIYLLLGLTLLGLVITYFAVPPGLVERHRSEKKFARRYGKIRDTLDELDRLALVAHLDAVRGQSAVTGPPADLIGELALNSRPAMEALQAPVVRLATEAFIPGAAPLAARLRHHGEEFVARPDSAKALERLLLSTEQLRQLAVRAQELREEDRAVNPLENQWVMTGLLLAALAALAWASVRILQSSRHTLRALDETIRQRDEQAVALQRERDFAAGLTNTAPVIMLLLDPRGIIQHVNPYFERLTGWRLDEVKGKEWFATFLPARDRDRMRDLFQKAVRDVPMHGSINPILTRHGAEREIEWNDQVMRDAQGNITGLLAIGLDITERKKHEQEREKLIAELQRALAEINTLSDLLPMCAWCKKVRDDKGYWADVASFFTKRKGIRWTHGMCPECEKAFLAELPEAFSSDAAASGPQET